MNITEKYFQENNIKYTIENGIICVDGNLNLRGLQGQQHKDFLKDTKIGGDLWLGGLQGQQHKDFLKGTTIGGDLWLRGLQGQQHKDFLKDTKIGGSLWLGGLQGQQHKDFLKDTKIGGSLWLDGLQGQQHKDFLKDTKIGGSLWLDGLQGQQHKDFLKGTTIGGDLWLDGLQGQQHKDFLKDTKVGGDLNADITNKPQQLIEGVFNDYIYVDGILTDRLSSHTVDGFVFHETSFGFVCEKDNVYAHGETLQQARRDYIFKTTEQDTSAYKNVDVDAPRTIDYLYTCYRLVTGSCRQGTERFMMSTDLSNVHTIRDTINITKGAYRSDIFKSFFLG